MSTGPPLPAATRMAVGPADGAGRESTGDRPPWDQQETPRSCRRSRCCPGGPSPPIPGPRSSPVLRQHSWASQRCVGVPQPTQPPEESGRCLSGRAQCTTAARVPDARLRPSVSAPIVATQEAEALGKKAADPPYVGDRARRSFAAVAGQRGALGPVRRWDAPVAVPRCDKDRARHRMAAEGHEDEALRACRTVRLPSANPCPQRTRRSCRHSAERPGPAPSRCHVLYPWLP